ncbi:hypothetical protein D3C86_2110620 [compost metagenome]
MGNVRYQLSLRFLLLIPSLTVKLDFQPHLIEDSVQLAKLIYTAVFRILLIIPL